MAVPNVIEFPITALLPFTCSVVVPQENKYFSSGFWLWLNFKNEQIGIW